MSRIVKNIVETLMFPGAEAAHEASDRHFYYLPVHRLGIIMPIWMMPAPHGSFVIIVYAHGNGTDIGSVRRELELVVKHARVHVCAFEFPGYGKCEASPSVPVEESVDLAAEAVLDFLVRKMHWPLRNIVFWGTSIGSAIMTRLCAKVTCGMIKYGDNMETRVCDSITCVCTKWENPDKWQEFKMPTATGFSSIRALKYDHVIVPKIKDYVQYPETQILDQCKCETNHNCENQNMFLGGLILQAPLVSIRKTASHMVGNMMSRVVISNETYDNEYALPRCKAPLLIIHGQKDEMFDYRESLKLLETFRGSGKMAVFPPHADHNTFELQADIIQPLKHYLQYYVKPRIHRIQYPCTTQMAKILSNIPIFKEGPPLPIDVLAKYRPEVYRCCLLRFVNGSSASMTVASQPGRNIPDVASNETVPRSPNLIKSPFARLRRRLRGREPLLPAEEYSIRAAIESKIVEHPFLWPDIVEESRLVTYKKRCHFGKEEIAFEPYPTIDFVPEDGLHAYFEVVGHHQKEYRQEYSLAFPIDDIPKPEPPPHEISESSSSFSIPPESPQPRRDSDDISLYSTVKYDYANFEDFLFPKKKEPKPWIPPEETYEATLQTTRRYSPDVWYRGDPGPLNTYNRIIVEISAGGSDEDHKAIHALEYTRDKCNVTADKILLPYSCRWRDFVMTHRNASLQFVHAKKRFLTELVNYLILQRKGCLSTISNHPDQSVSVTVKSATVSRTGKSAYIGNVNTSMMRHLILTGSMPCYYLIYIQRKPSTKMSGSVPPIPDLYDVSGFTLHGLFINGFAITQGAEQDKLRVSVKYVGSGYAVCKEDYPKKDLIPQVHTLYDLFPFPEYLLLPVHHQRYEARVRSALASDMVQLLLEFELHHPRGTLTDFLVRKGLWQLGLMTAVDFAVTDVPTRFPSLSVDGETAMVSNTALDIYEFISRLNLMINPYHWLLGHIILPTDNLNIIEMIGRATTQVMPVVPAAPEAIDDLTGSDVDYFELEKSLGPNEGRPDSDCSNPPYVPRPKELDTDRKPKPIMPEDIEYQRKATLFFRWQRDSRMATGVRTSKHEYELFKRLKQAAEEKKLFADCVQLHLEDKSDPCSDDEVDALWYAYHRLVQWYYVGTDQQLVSMPRTCKVQYTKVDKYVWQKALDVPLFEGGITNSDHEYVHPHPTDLSITFIRTEREPEILLRALTNAISDIKTAEKYFEGQQEIRRGESEIPINAGQTLEKLTDTNPPPANEDPELWNKLLIQANPVRRMPNVGEIPTIDGAAEAYLHELWFPTLPVGQDDLFEECRWCLDQLALPLYDILRDTDFKTNDLFYGYFAYAFSCALKLWRALVKLRLLDLYETFSDSLEMRVMLSGSECKYETIYRLGAFFCHQWLSKVHSAPTTEIWTAPVESIPNVRRPISQEVSAAEMVALQDCFITFTLALGSSCAQHEHARAERAAVILRTNT